MMVPPGTTCPPNALKPKRCAFESRPFRELPKPFLCAMDWFPVSGFLFQIVAAAGYARPTRRPPALLFLFRCGFLYGALLGGRFLCLTLGCLCFECRFGFRRLRLFRLRLFFLQLRSGEFLPIHGDLGDPHRGVALSVSTEFFVLFLALVMEDQNLGPAALFHDFAGYERRGLGT